MEILVSVLFVVASLQAESECPHVVLQGKKG